MHLDALKTITRLITTFTLSSNKIVAELARDINDLRELLILKIHLINYFQSLQTCENPATEIMLQCGKPKKLFLNILKMLKLTEINICPH